MRNTPSSESDLKILLVFVTIITVLLSATALGSAVNLTTRESTAFTHSLLNFR
ncbi:MAG: hypothetical protein VKJ24_13160 [Synechococcales bacterium]|nr:hypothetical protein [Synechococcales bacterium]